MGKGSSNASTIAHRKFACGEALFERYYRAQRVTASEGDDFQALMRALATPLPATFRAHAREEMGGDVSRALAAIGEGSVREVFPGAWEAANPTGETKRGRSVVPREVLEVFEEASTSGRGSRQEIVSMLPVLALNPPSGAKVLDVCAAPDRRLCSCWSARDTVKGGAEGVVHANDAHPGRVRTLLDAIERHGRDPRELVGLFVTRASGKIYIFRCSFRRRGHDAATRTGAHVAHERQRRETRSAYRTRWIHARARGRAVQWRRNDSERSGLSHEMASGHWQRAAHHAAQRGAKMRASVETRRDNGILDVYIQSD